MKRAFIALALCATFAASMAADPSNEITSENVLAIMNAYRAERSLPPLHSDTLLTDAAWDRMHDMEDGGWWSHESPEGRSPFHWLAERAYDYAYAGENLAAGFETARLLVSSWMESAGHRANIMGAQYQDVGIAIIDGSTKGPATGRSIVVLFGRKRAEQHAAVTRP